MSLLCHNEFLEEQMQKFGHTFVQCMQKLHKALWMIPKLTSERI